jgi:hypothetical protein
MILLLRRALLPLPGLLTRCVPLPGRILLLHRTRLPSPVLLLSFFLLAPPVCRSGGWENLLATLNLTPEFGARILSPEETARLDADGVRARLEEGYVVVLTGCGGLADYFGFAPTGRTVTVRSITDTHHPKQQIVWEDAVDLPVCEVRAGAEVYTRERWQGAPLAAGIRMGPGAILWLATDPGAKGHERFPYLLNALLRLGLEPPVKARNLWLFFDSSYRMRVDPEYMARRWRSHGVSALHIAAWHYFEADSQRDDYLTRLIGACHRNAIHVYAWLELPHVSEQFWTSHPEWREKTALGMDAHLDWRKLINLRNPDCVRAVRSGVEDLLRRFDWDGVNLAELYFESLEGHQNPARFTPLNDDVRREFQRLAGWDPIDLWDLGSVRHHSRSASSLMQFLNYRATLARAMQEEWLGVLEGARKLRPHLDLVLTHVDNLLDPETRDRIGADAKVVLPLLEKHNMTFLIEDPATAWNLGPERYPAIASKYAGLTRHPERLAIDINVVERYQDVYPTKQQTGVELLREIHLAAAAFPRVTLYFESSILAPDWPLLPYATAVAQAFQRDNGRAIIRSPRPIAVRWNGPAKVNGAPWPALDSGWVWLPAGEHTVEKGDADPPIRILDFNGDLRSAQATASGLEFSYECSSRALAVLSKPPRRLLIDHEPVEPKLWIFDDSWILVLPQGQHLVSVPVDPGL